MSVIRFVTIWCDDCDVEFPTRQRTTDLAFRQAKAEGWTHANRTDIDRCPDCTAKAEVERRRQHGGTREPARV